MSDGHVPYKSSTRGVYRIVDIQTIETKDLQFKKQRINLTSRCIGGPLEFEEDNSFHFPINHPTVWSTEQKDRSHISVVSSSETIRSSDVSDVKYSSTNFPTRVPCLSRHNPIPC